ncbi:hypothetical protein LTR28_002478 [Elasticomyces elasticus]|nr:hypothetical protein LTR28_002478 [Elasticomyces elasticus]
MTQCGVVIYEAPDLQLVSDKLSRKPIHTLDSSVPFYNIVQNTTPALHFTPSRSHRYACSRYLELYTMRTDGWGLMTLAAMLLIVSGAVPLAGSSSSHDAARVKKSYAKAAIAATVCHHLLTAYGAYQHFSKPTHYKNAMAVGLYGSGGLAVLGALVLLMDDTAERTPRLRKTA